MTNEPAARQAEAGHPQSDDAVAVAAASFLLVLVLALPGAAESARGALKGDRAFFCEYPAAAKPRHPSWSKLLEFCIILPRPNSIV
jgi:hypothetical protein